MKIDHGIYSWLPYVTEPPWPAPVLPIAVNMVRHPIPTSQRLRKLGAAMRAAIESYPGNARVAVIATGGMSHQISGARFGMANEEWDRYFLAHRPTISTNSSPSRRRRSCASAAPRRRNWRIWFAMRGALSDKAHHVYDFYTFPQITGCGVIVLDEAAR